MHLPPIRGQGPEPGGDPSFLIVWPSEEAVAFYARAGFREVAEAHDGPDDYPPLELMLTAGGPQHERPS